MYDSFLYYSKFSYNKVDSFPDKYVLATIHRRENLLHEEKLKSIFNNLDKINDHIKVLLPLHPHTKKDSRVMASNQKSLSLSPWDIHYLLTP